VFSLTAPMILTPFHGPAVSRVNPGGVDGVHTAQ
jgi:hypothetical protein